MTVEIEKLMLDIQSARGKFFISNDRVIIQELAKKYQISEKTVRFSLAQIMANAIKECTTTSELENVVVSFLTFETPDKILNAPWFNDGFRFSGTTEKNVEILKAVCVKRLIALKDELEPVDETVIEKISQFIRKSELTSDPIYGIGFKEYCNSIVRLLCLHINLLDEHTFFGIRADSSVNLIIDKSVKLNLADADGRYFRSKAFLMSISDRVDVDQLDRIKDQAGFTYYIHSGVDIDKVIPEKHFHQLTGIFKQLGFIPALSLTQSSHCLTYVLPGIYPVMIEIKFGNASSDTHLFYVG